jgi:hypothetical protein
MAGIRPLAATRQYEDIKPSLERRELTADLQKPFLLLGVLGNIDLVDIVFQTQLFKCNVYFVAIGCAWISLVVVLTRRVHSDTCGVAVGQVLACGTAIGFTLELTGRY